MDLNNALLFGISSGLIKTLQAVQNAAARIVVRADRYTRAKPILKKLHWRSVQQRINFHIILLTFKALHGLTATCISESISIKIVSRDLRNNKGLLLMEHIPKHTFGKRAFSDAAPKLWNKLPFAIRNFDNINSFKKNIENSFISVLLSAFEHPMEKALYKLTIININN